MNKVLLTGRLTRDPELRTTPNGKSVVDFGLAVQETKDEVVFVECTAWEGTADFIGNPDYFHKGKGIGVEGRLKLDQWEDKNDGTKRSKLFVTVQRAEFAISDPKGGGDEVVEDAPKAKKTRQVKPKAVAAPTTDDGDDDDDVPF